MIETGTDFRVFDMPNEQDYSGPRIALVNMCTDEQGEDAFRSLMPPQVKLFTARVGLDADAYIAGEVVPIGGFGPLAASFPPKERIDLIAFSCTSGAIAGGDGFVEDGFRATHDGIPCTNPAVAAAAGLKHAGVKRMALLSPYPQAIHEQFIPYFSERGIETVASGSFNTMDDAAVGRVSYRTFADSGKQLLDSSDADALFISCAAFDVVGHLPRLSDELGKPVYSSTQLFAWHAMSILGL